MSESNLSPAMLADLAALSRGDAPPARNWWDRPWKAGEPCWVFWVGPGHDVHIYPCRIARYDALVMEQEGFTTPLVEFQLDPEGDESVMIFPREEAHLYAMTKVEPRIVEGESW